MFASRLEAQSPLKKIGGGYGFVTDQKDHRIDSVTQVKAGDGIKVIVRDGSMEAVISRINQSDEEKKDDPDRR